MEEKHNSSGHMKPPPAASIEKDSSISQQGDPEEEAQPSTTSDPEVIIEYPKPPSKVTLSDVQNAFPPESTEDCIVMQHIERIDPTNVGNDDNHEDWETLPSGSRIYKAPTADVPGLLMDGSQRSLLDQATALPPELVASMHEEKMQQMQQKERKVSSDLSERRSKFALSHQPGFFKRNGGPQTVESELFELTNMLRPTQSGEYDGSNNAETDDENSRGEEINEERRPLTQSQAFAAHAAGMFQHLARKVEGRSASFPGAASLSGGGNKSEGAESDGENSSNPRNSRPSSIRKQANVAMQNMKEVERIIKTGRKSIFAYARFVFLFIIFPCTAVAFLLYYALGNPGADVIYVIDPSLNVTESDTITGTRVVSNNQPSYSWLFLFFGVRQVITFGLAVGLQHLVISYYQQAGLNFTFVGPMARLFIIQSKGWPLMLAIWGFLNLAMLYGSTRFANHWLFYQSFIGIFSDQNPSGNFPSYDIYRHVVIFILCAGIAVALKRFIIGLKFGQNTYYRYADRLSGVLKDILQVSQVSRLPEIKSDYIAKTKQSFVEEAVECNIWLEKHAYVDNTTASTQEQENSEAPAMTIDENGDVRPSLDLGSFSEDVMSSAQQLKITELLGEWEEIELSDKTTEDPSLNAIVQFGSSVGVLRTSYPFGQAFGKAETRHQVVDCAQRLYADLLKLQQRLKLREIYANAGGLDPVTTLKFHTLSIVAMDDLGNLDMKMAKELMAVFRPTREGDISLVEFVKSVDTVYKEIRKLRASIANEGKMNAGTEKLINAVFYFILAFCLLAALGLDPMVIFGGLAAFIISFSFCVSGASSDYIRGLLFILVQRPYDIGDCVALASPNAPADGNGSPQWTVKDVSLYHTTVVFNFSNEIGTISNGSIASMRVLNASRSPRANLHFFLKFGIRVKLETIELFRTKLYDYIKSKPREWLRPVAFRLSLIAADLGYSQYFILLTHREPWNQKGALMNSLSDVQQFCFRLIAQLDMGYESPPLPIQMEQSSATAFHNMITAMQNNNTNSNISIPPSLNAAAVYNMPDSTGNRVVYTTPDQNMVDTDIVDT
ncbi:mechanosensitive ion channel [Nitzschia inconspicua]|uniref:Mechanosensitive ion channel n=1 Tax=Nitzschia inconspicua TaxID=303405 RepID=A0A9K3M1G6_9STRA|nr:mechanosensitive ion channel [Nitzschia inconspicua]